MKESERLGSESIKNRNLMKGERGRVTIGAGRAKEHSTRPIDQAPVSVLTLVFCLL